MRGIGRKRALALLEESLRGRNFAEATSERISRSARRFLDATGGQPLDKVDPNDVRRYLSDRLETVRPNSAALDLGAIRTLYACLVEAGRVEQDPTEGIEIASTPSRPPVVLSERTVSSLFAQSLVANVRMRRRPEIRRAVALRDRAMLELLYGTGLRASEACAMLVLDFDRDHRAILCRRTKRGVSRCLPLPAGALPHLEVYLREGRPLLVRHGTGRDEGRFLVTERGTPLASGDVNERVREVGRRLGTRAHPHAFRRALATHLVRAGASLVAVRELLGHSRLDTTQRYVEVDRQDLRKATSVLEADGAFRSGRASCVGEEANAQPGRSP